MKKTVFIGIPCYRESEMLTRTIDFLRRNSTVANTLEAHVAEQSVVRNKNVLLQKARHSSAEYICLCDDDVEPEPGWDAKLIHGVEEVHARTKRMVGQTGPLILFPDNRVFSSWTDVYFDIDGSRGFYSPVGMGEPCREVYRAKLFAGALTGALTIFTRAFLERISWQFDDRYEKSQYDDVDQSLTCREHGFVVLYNGSVSVIHHVTQRSPRSVQENNRKLTDKWISRPELTLVIPPDEAAVRQAEDGVYRPLPSMWDTVSQIYKAARVNPVHRFGAGIRALRTRGLKGLMTQFRQKMREAAKYKS